MTQHEEQDFSQGKSGFDIRRIGGNIMRARKARGLTQMELAERMNVSFQAVSNWERGQSCPDISRLSELSELLEVSVDDLLGSRRMGGIARSIAAHEPVEDLKPEEAEQIAPLLREPQAEELAGQMRSGGSGEVPDLRELACLAPFVSEAFLDAAAREACAAQGLDALRPIAPFLSEKTLGELARAFCERDGFQSVQSIAPFLSGEDLTALVQDHRARGGSLRDIQQVAPFLPDDTADELGWEAYTHGGAGEAACWAPFLSKRMLERIARQILEKDGLSGLGGLAPFLDEAVLESYFRKKWQTPV